MGANGETIIGKCLYCMKYTNLHRTYFKFNIECECHSPKHFEIVEHCMTCRPKCPSYTSVLLKKDLVDKSYFKNDAENIKIYLKDLKTDNSESTLSSEIRLWVPTYIITDDSDYNTWELVTEFGGNDGKG